MKLILPFLFLIHFSSFAQIWVNSNPTWYYHYETSDFFFEFGEFKITEIGDSIIEGMNCKMLQQEKSTWDYYNGNGHYIGTEIFDTNYVRVDGDTVFYYQHGQFRTLYNFGSNAGDSWLVHVTDESSNCEDSTFVTVTQTGIINIGGIDYRSITLETIQYPDYRLSGTFVERFGKYNAPSTFDYTQGTLFPYSSCQSEFLLTDFTLACFTDDLLSYQVFPECFLDPVFSGLNEVSSKKLNIYPNPSNGNLKIDTESVIKEIILFDLKGTELENYSLNNSEELEILQKPGIYLLKIVLENGDVETHKIYIL